MGVPSRTPLAFVSRERPGAFYSPTVSGFSKFPEGPRPLPGLFKTVFWWEFPDGPVIRTLDFYCCGVGLIPGQGTKISQVVQQGQKKKGNK